jgi:hypothetical protein
MFRSDGKGAWVGLVLIGVLTVGSVASAAGDDGEVPAVSGKKQAYMGDPSHHRGVELGYDRGYLAAKADQGEGLSPDLGRHAVYHDPNPMYRYEFGNRGTFYHGFRSGFLVGYRQVWGKGEVAYVVPRKGLADGPGGGGVNGIAAGMETERMAPDGGTSPSPRKAKAAKGAASAQVVSDAL